MKSHSDDKYEIQIISLSRLLPHYPFLSRRSEIVFGSLCLCMNVFLYGFPSSYLLLLRAIFEVLMGSILSSVLHDARVEDDDEDDDERFGSKV